MKKSLIALAVLAASGAAMAQSSVTLFGVIDTNISVIDNIGAGKDDKYGLGTSGLQTSRIGFRGVEDLGGGLKAGFHLEGEIFGDDGNSSGLDFKRRSTLSLMGGFGEVRLGRDQTVGWVKASSYDVFGQAGYGQFLGWSSWSAVGPDTNGIRKSNMISYFTPKFSGFSGAIGYGFDEQTSGSLGEYLGGYVAYDNGPLSVTLSYDQSELGALAAGTTPARKIDRDTIALGASYDFGVAKVSGIYQQVKHDEAGRNDVKVNSYALGVSAPVGSAGIVKAQYAMYDQKNVVQGRDAEANHFSLGYQHNLSKRTALYGTVSYMDNDNGSTVGLSGKGMGTTTPASGESQTGFQVGIRHAF